MKNDIGFVILINTVNLLFINISTLKKLIDFNIIKNMLQS